MSVGSLRLLLCSCVKLELLKPISILVDLSFLRDISVCTLGGAAVTLEKVKSATKEKIVSS